LPECQFTTQYFNYEIGKEVDFNCDDEEPLASGRCILHDEGYLQDKEHEKEHKKKVIEKLRHTVNDAISNNKALLCIGFQLPGFSFSDLDISKEFTKPVYFINSQFFGKADFSEANFKGKADFLGAKFEGEVAFYNSEFYGKTYFSGQFNGITNFNYVLFEGKEKIYFDIENLSNVSFMNTDITGVRFRDKARWRRGGGGGKKVKEVNIDISTQLKD
jgi:hypothetical protein